MSQIRRVNRHLEIDSPTAPARPRRRAAYAHALRIVRMAGSMFRREVGTSSKAGTRKPASAAVCSDVPTCAYHFLIEGSGACAGVGVQRQRSRYIRFPNLYTNRSEQVGTSEQCTGGTGLKVPTCSDRSDLGAERATGGTARRDVAGLRGRLVAGKCGWC